MQVSTLELTLDASGALRALEQFDNAAESAGASADKLTSFTKTLGASQQKLVSEVQAVVNAANALDAGNTRAVAQYLRQVESIRQLAAGMNQLSLVEVALDEAQQSALKNQQQAIDYAGRLSAARRQLAADTRAQAAAEAQAATGATAAAAATGRLNTSALGAGTGIGRLRQSFASLAAVSTGTSPIVDRIATTLGAFAVGNGEMIAILATITALGYAWKVLSGDIDQAKKALEEYEKTDAARTARSVGEMGVKMATGGNGSAAQIDVEAPTAKIAALREALRALDDQMQAPDNAYIGRFNAVNEQLVRLRTGYVQGTVSAKQFTDAIAGMERLFPDYAPQIAHTAAMGYELIALRDETREVTAAFLEQRAELAKLQEQYGQTFPEAIQQLDRLNQEAAALKQGGPAALQRVQNTFAAQDMAQKLWGQYTQTKQGAPYDTLAYSDALVGKGGLDAWQHALEVQNLARQTVAARQQIEQGPKAASQGAHADDTLTKFQEQLAAFKQQADSFGKDDTIIAQMQRFTDALNHEITVLQRAGDAKSKAMIPGIEHIRDQVPTVTTELQGKVQTQADTGVQAQIAKLHDETVAQDALNATRSQSADAVRAVMIANAASLAVDAAKAEYAKQGLTLSKALTDQLYAQAAAYEASKRYQDPVETFSSSAHDLVSQVQDNLDTHTGDPSAEMEQLNKAIVDAQDAQYGLNSTSRDYLDLNEAINALIRERKQLLDAMKKPGALQSGGADAAQVLRGAGDVANIMKNRPLGNLLNTGGSIAQNTTAAVGSGFTNIGADVGAITSVVSFVTQLFGTSALAQEWKSVMTANNAAIQQLTLKLSGFTVNAGNTLGAASAIGAFEADPAAVSALSSWSTAGGMSLVNGQALQHGGDLQSQINALGPYLNQIFGPTSSMSQLDAEWTKLDAIAKQYGITLTDQQGRILPAELANLTTALNTAAQAAFTMANTFSNNLSLLNLGSAIKGQGLGSTANLTAYDNALQAWRQTAPGEAGGLPGISTENSTQGMAQTRAWALQIWNEMQSGQISPASMGGLQGFQDLENSIQAVIDPLNAMTTAVNGAVAAFTNLPSGFRAAQAAYDQYLASPVQAATGILAANIPVQKGTPANSATPGSSATTATAPVVITGDVTIVSSATNAQDLLNDIATQLKSQTARGGTSAAALAIQRAAGLVS